MSRRDRGADKKIQTEAYWFESIIVPRVVEPLLDFLTQQHDKIIAIKAQSARSKDPFPDFLISHQKKYARLLGKLRLVRILSQKTYDAVIDELDELDGDIAWHCFYESALIKGAAPPKNKLVDISEKFSDTMSNAVSEFRRLHASLREI